MFRVANVYFPTQPTASGNVSSSWGKRKGKFNFRNPKLLFYDYAVCVGAYIGGRTWET